MILTFCLHVQEHTFESVFEIYFTCYKLKENTLILKFAVNKNKGFS